MCDEVGSSRDQAKPLSITAYRAARAWLEQAGYLGLVSRGWTSRLRASVLDDGTSVSAVFVLTIPRRPAPLPQREPYLRNRALARSRSELAHVHGRARVETPTEERPAAALTPETSTGSAPNGPKRQRRTSERAVGAELGGRDRVAARLSPAYLAHLARPFLAAGWTPGDLVHALGHGPDGRQHGWTDDVVHAAGWIRSRLALWLDPAGSPLPSPSQLRAAERARVRAEQTARRAERLRAAERPVDVAAHAGRAREMLAAALARAPAAL